VVRLEVVAGRVDHRPTPAHFTLVRVRELLPQLGTQFGRIHTAETLASAAASTDACAYLGGSAGHCGLQATRARSEGVVKDCLFSAITAAG
jgi:hypothetical protein